MAADAKVKVATPKTFVVISSPDDDLAVMLAMSLATEKQRLHEKFNGSRVPSFYSMVAHFDDSVNQEELATSIDDVLSDKKNFMMVLSGYQNNDEWNNALKDYMAAHKVSATFISLDGQNPPDDIEFHARTTLLQDDEIVVTLARNAVREARFESARQAKEQLPEEMKQRLFGKEAASPAPPRILH